MTLTEYLRVLRRQWWVVLLLTSIGLACAGAYTRSLTPTYSAGTQMFISVATADPDITQLSSGSTFTQQRVKSYAAIVTSPLLLRQVITMLDLPYSPAQLATEIKAESPLDTVLLDVTVEDTDARRAADIANAVAERFPEFVARLERPVGRTTSPVKVSVTERASVPAEPISPRVPLNLALGLLIGVGVGIGAAVLRDHLNTSVSSIGDMERLTGAIPLGVVPYDSATNKHPLVTEAASGGRAEAFRTLRTNLQFADVDSPPRVIVVTSPLPGEGKTTSACNLAFTLSLSGSNVILLDGDLRKPSVSKYLGISGAAGLTNVLAGHHDLASVAVEYRDSLAVLPSGPTPPNPSELLGSQHMHDLVEVLSRSYDYVVIDAPPLLPVTDAAVLSALADGAVLVVRQGRTRREAVNRALQALAAVNAPLLGSVLNFAAVRKRGGYDTYGEGYGRGASSPEVVSPLRPASKLPVQIRLDRADAGRTRR